MIKLSIDTVINKFYQLLIVTISLVTQIIEGVGEFKATISTAIALLIYWGIKSKIKDFKERKKTNNYDK